MQRVAVVFLWLLIASVFAAFYGIGYMHVTSNKIKVPVRENKIINGDSHTGGSSVGDVSPGDTEERQRSINSVKMKDNQIRGKHKNSFEIYKLKEYKRVKYKRCFMLILNFENAVSRLVLVIFGNN